MDIGEEELDILKELINIGVGRAAGMLNEMTGCTIRLSVPTIRLLTVKELADANNSVVNEDVATVSLSFNGSLSGLSVLAFPPESAAALVMLLSGESEESPELDAISTETLKEVSNIVLNCVMGSIANHLRQHLTYTLPRYQEISVLKLSRSASLQHEEELAILADTHFNLEEKEIDGRILLILEVGSLESLMNAAREMPP